MFTNLCVTSKFTDRIIFPWFLHFPLLLAHGAQSSFNKLQSLINCYFFSFGSMRVFFKGYLETLFLWQVRRSILLQFFVACERRLQKSRNNFKADLLNVDLFRGEAQHQSGLPSFNPAVLGSNLGTTERKMLLRKVDSIKPKEILHCSVRTCILSQRWLSYLPSTDDCKKAIL